MQYVETTTLALDAAAVAEALPCHQLIDALAIDDGSIQESDIKSELRDLVTGSASGRVSDDAITLFKSIGTAIESPAAAEVVVKNQLRVA